MAGQYRDDERVGQFVWWHENGTRALAGRYDDGFKIGKWEWWHPNGMKSIEGQYDDDEPVGQWTWWNEDGDVADRDDFGEGRDSMGDLPDPDAATDEESGQDGDISEKPPEGGVPDDDREEIRPYPDPFDGDTDSTDFEEVEAEFSGGNDETDSSDSPGGF